MDAFNKVKPLVVSSLPATTTGVFTPSQIDLMFTALGLVAENIGKKGRTLTEEAKSDIIGIGHTLGLTEEFTSLIDYSQAVSDDTVAGLKAVLFPSPHGGNENVN